MDFDYICHVINQTYQMQNTSKQLYQISKEMIEIAQMIERFEAMGGQEEKIEILDFEYWRLSRMMEEGIASVQVDSMLEDLNIEKEGL